MFGSFFNFQSKKDGKGKTDESGQGKKSKSKKSKDSKKENKDEIPENETTLNVTKLDEEEQFEDIRSNASAAAHDNNQTEIEVDLPVQQVSNDRHVENGVGLTVQELLHQLETVEGEARRLADGLEQMTADKAALEREMSALRSDNERLRANTETLVAEKWELSAANADLQNRIQSMAMTYMQGIPDTMLQEELHKLQMALSDERKVTEKLSRNLELEKRRSESLEQKAKTANRRSGASVTGTVSVLPEEVRQRDDILSNSMEKYRLHCERLSSSLEDCEKKLTGFEIQEDYHAADLRKELSAVKRLLNEDRRRSSGESQKLFEVQTLFGQVYKDYNNLIEALKHQEKQIRKNQVEESHHVDVELANKYRRVLEEVEIERQKVEHVTEKLRKFEIELDTIPLLKAQVEVYRSDFNAEREARQKIAGEKSDLLEELHRLRNEGDNKFIPADVGDAAAARRPPARPQNETPRLLPTTNFVRETAHQFAEMAPQPNSPPPRPAKPKDGKQFSCPKCGKSFPILQILQNHVNACLDREE